MNTTLNPHRLHRRYVPDVTRLLLQCERNYLQLVRLLAVGDVAGRGDRHRALELSVLEDDRYTTTLLMQEREVQETQMPELGGGSHWALSRRRLIVRLYHDARLAEVLEWHKRRILRGSYPYPNAMMVQRDEKQRVNEFLGEWLGYCQRRQLPVHCLRNAGATPATRTGTG